MMNAEVMAGEERIIIPTVYRNNYLTALKALSQNTQPTPIIRALDFARKWVVAVQWTDLDTARRPLESCHAFVDPAEADDRGIRLRLPGLVEDKGTGRHPALFERGSDALVDRCSNFPDRE